MPRFPPCDGGAAGATGLLPIANAMAASDIEAPADIALPTGDLHDSTSSSASGMA